MLKRILKKLGATETPISPLRFAVGASNEAAKQFSTPLSAIRYARSRSKLEGRRFWFCDRQKQYCYPIEWQRRDSVAGISLACT